MLSQRVREIQPSATLAVNARRIELEREGRKIANLSVGEPDFETPEVVREAAKRAIDEGRTRYTPSPGTLELRQAVAEHVTRTRGEAVDAESVVVSSGAKGSLSTALLSQVDRGDEVLIPSPYWVSYPELVRLCEGQPLVVDAPREDGFKVRPEALERAITPRTVGLVLNSPSNPTGAVYSEEELSAIVDLAEEHDLWILSDEIYEDFLFEESTLPSPFRGRGRERTILVSGASKSFSMTGFRIGWLVADPKLAKACSRLQGHATGNACSISQAAAVAALRDLPPEFLEENRSEFRRRRDRLVGGLSAIDGVEVSAPDGAFYLFADCRGVIDRLGLKDDLALATGALDAGVAVVPGSAFGAPGFVRFSFAASDETLDEAVRSLRTAWSG